MTMTPEMSWLCIVGGGPVGRRPPFSCALSCGPSALHSYSGELIGMQYLFRQTGQALQDMHPDSEETAKLIEEHDVEDNLEEDEGFCDLPEDPTVVEVLEPSLTPSSSTVSSTAPSSSSTHPSSASVTEVENVAVDEINIPGYHHVDSLSENLVELHEQTALCLSNQQVDTVISLWQSLDDHDKQKVLYVPLHQDRRFSGNFRTPEKPSTTPGVESATRCTLGTSSVPAQWPDCCRLVENIFIRLSV